MPIHLVRIFLKPIDLANYQLNKAVFCQLLIEAKIEELQAQLEVNDKRIVRLTNYINGES